MTSHSITRSGATLSGTDTGQGRAVVFQHGLGGGEAQVAEHFPQPGFRRLTLECRAHGKSGAGASSGFSIPRFAEDVLAFADARGVERFAVGGISMGAAIALRLAVIAPERVTSLVLARPAWGWSAAPANMQVFAEIAGHLEAGSRETFEATPTAQHFAREAPDNLASFRGFFDRPDLKTTAALFRGIAGSGPEVTEEQVGAIRIPVLVIGNDVDLVHPLSLASQLAAAIQKARLVEITPKAIDRQKHVAEFQAALRTHLETEGPRN